ncbi:MAG: carboxymuconolactone decarboxylase family protein [Candidatus Thermoplasmatota archaeon]|nr:carboxymuconolactone decarboxylase family protein [Candidatus Thermoplasmatota archaeon]MBS3801557.1 carboxymuconolactone decarboxylase family protein [Candidatus Thermoplasmatota archaeon]
MKKAPEFLEILEKKDAEYTSHIKANLRNNHEDKALPAKVKLLMAMALDAAHGDREGVNQLSKRAYEAGATEAEMLETAEVVGTTCGLQGLYIALKGLDVFSRK